MGGDSGGNQLDVALNPAVSTVQVKVLSDKLSAASTAFTLKGSAPGVSFKVSAFVKSSGRRTRYADDLQVTVGGTPTRQPGYSVDLLTDVAANGSAYQVYQYNRIILGPSDKKHILSQNTDAGHYNCGDTAAAYGKKIFGQETSTVYYQYYVTPTTDKVADLRFDATRMGQAIAKIKSMVSKGKPVRVWLIHHDGFSRPRIQDDTRTHFLTIIGFSLDRFLYLDPWPHGSRLDYSGGMFPKTRIAFMGELTWDPANLELGIYSPPDYKGLHNYKVIAGP